MCFLNILVEKEVGKETFPILLWISQKFKNLEKKLIQDGKERPVVLNPGKLLHAGNKYNWEGCVDVKPGDKLKITAKWGKVWLIEKTMVLFAELLVTVKNQNDELVCKPTVTVAVRPGGY